MEQMNRTRSISGSQSCSVCFRSFDLSAVGECEHPICYVCSSKLRVVCDRKECPVCRQTLNDVIITSGSEPYSKLKKNMYKHDEVRYQMRFENLEAKSQFLELLKKMCPICNKKFNTFPNLREHMKKAHDHFYCDLCVEHLKIFHTERKSYNKIDLKLHNTKGDKDDSSHKGHPLCEFCDIRFFNADILYKHMRTAHFFCHICENVGQNVFFSLYAEMRRHFQRSHFVCYRQECRVDEFFEVFSTMRELKEHEMEKHFGEVYEVCRPKPLERPYSVGGASNNSSWNSTSRRPSDYESIDSSRKEVIQKKRKKSNFLDGLFASGYYRDEPYYMGSDRLEVEMEPKEEFPCLAEPSRKPKNRIKAGPLPVSRGAFHQNASQALNSRIEFPPLVPSGRNANSPGAKSSGSVWGANKNSANVKSKDNGGVDGRKSQNGVTKKGNTRGKGSASSLPDGFSDTFRNGVSISDRNSASVTGYIRPRNFKERNEALMACIKEGLQNNKTKFERFVKVSKTFRDSKISAFQYFIACLEILGEEGMGVVMRELLCLLPDITKQTRFMLACKGNVAGVVVCPFCNQVMDVRDKDDHEAVHAGISDYM